MRNLATADERERRFVEYVRTLNKGQLAELQLTRLNRVSNFRKGLMRYIEDFIEARAEIIAVSMWMENAPDRPKRPEVAAREVIERKRRTPPWIKKEAARLRGGAL